LTSSVSGAALFGRLWRAAIERLRLLGAAGTLRFAARAPLLTPRPGAVELPESEFLALTKGDVAVFPGRPRSGRLVVLIVSPYPPFPLSHGGAVRMFNLMRRAARDYDQVLICFTSQLDTPAAELPEICAEAALATLTRRHPRPRTDRPELVGALA